MFSRCIYYLCPDAYVSSIFEINLKALKAKGFKGIIIDLDNTLVKPRSQEVSEEVISWIKAMGELGYKRCLLSNSLPKRVQAFSSKFGIPCISRAAKPRKKVFLRALSELGTKSAETAVIGDQLFTDILGGKRSELFTILVSPLDKKELLTTALMRYPEKMILNFLNRRGLLKPL
jgi:HAD superfamily phosphatase (TIGR01668 family)